MSIFLICKICTCYLNSFIRRKLIQKVFVGIKNVRVANKIKIALFWEFVSKKIALDNNKVVKQ